MRISEFINRWLYGKNGYYTEFKEIGKEGDFYTSVSSSIFFGGSIAKKLISSIKNGLVADNVTILEIGAHKGYLLADIIQFIYTLEPKLIETLNFAILEPQPQIQKIQKKYFRDSFGDFVNVKFFSSFDEISLDFAFVIANEIFDAFACEVVKDDKMLYIDDNFEPYFDKLSPFAKEISNKYHIKKGEISIGYEEFANNLSKSIKRFEFITFDYGEKEARGDFSLRIYDKHKVYPFFSLTKFVKDDKSEYRGIDLKSLYKKSDITHDVDFIHLIDAFKEAGIQNIAYMTQMKALIEFGLIELLELLKEKSSEKAYLDELNKVKLLIDPAFLGERFKCVIFRK